MKQFTNLYQVSKTLRFELIPDKRTKEYLEQSELIKNDEHRAESYKLVKKIIDRYHKEFIEDVLSKTKLQYANEGKNNSLEELYVLYINPSRTENDKKRLEKVQELLRKQIADALKQDSRFKRIDKKELIREDILKVIKPDEKKLIDEFRDFTTYFTGFHENRQNMYSAEAQSTSIAYRLIHENLPKFIDNIGTFQKILKSPIVDKLPTLYKEMEEYLNVNNLEELFMLDYYTNLLTQTQIEVYNAVIGGRTLEDGTKIQGINEFVNLHNQRQTSSDTRLPKLKPLFKQILSDREAVSWLPEEFESDQELLKTVKNFHANLKNNVLIQLRELLLNLPQYDLKHIYIPNNLALTEISQSIWGDWGIIKNAIISQLKCENPQKKKENTEKYEDRISKVFKSFESFSISFLNSCISRFSKDICSHFISLGAVNNENKQTINLFLQIEDAYIKIKNLLEKDYPKNHNLSQDKENVNLLKTFLDTIKSLQHFVKPLLGAGNEAEKDERFFGEIDFLWNELNGITPLYNKVRNRMTQKPYSTEKFKLNFENSTLLDGWDVNKERDNSCAILRKKGLYYLAIMRKDSNKLFLNAPVAKEDESFEKMEYKLLPGANKMLPKVFFSKSRIDEFNPSPTLLEHYQQGTHKKGDKFNLNDCHELIDFFKSTIKKHDDWSKFDFTFSPTESYEDLSDFYKEVEQMGYKVSFKKIPITYIDSMVSEGKLFLFQIYNKDFSEYSSGIPNLHTLYWKMLFNEQNLTNVIYKLNGQAEVFYRRKSINTTQPTHRANLAIRNKNSLNDKKESVFTYDLFKDKRYIVDKFQFHVPITINFKAIGIGNINPIVNQHIQKSSDLHIIGIDRGERHLLYVTVIDSKGQIKEQFSMNKIYNEYKGKTYQTDYHSLLDKREGERQKERQSWSTIEGIKDLKKGYLSQVIHKIVTLMMKYNAIVVLEDLNSGFKRGRQKVESSVYQQFEKALIEKLNLLVDKNKNPNELGGLMKAFQLTNKFTKFRDMSKQNGFLFYIPAWNTSKIDPNTGFVDLLHPKYESVEKSRAFFCKFQSIRYNDKKDWYEFAFDYNDFTSKAGGTRTCWTICTQGTRVETFRNKEKNSSWDSKEVILTEEFHTLFKQYGILNQGNIKKAIAEQKDKSFFEALMYLLRLTLQMRNSITGTDIDYLISPVADEKGIFYDSRKCGFSLPENADANGAYNIARKGLWITRQIREAENIEKVNLTISNKEWLTFCQTKPYLND